MGWSRLGWKAHARTPDFSFVWPRNSWMLSRCIRLHSWTTAFSFFMANVILSSEWWDTKCLPAFCPPLMARPIICVGLAESEVWGLVPCLRTSALSVYTLSRKLLRVILVALGSYRLFLLLAFTFFIVTSWLIWREVRLLAKLGLSLGGCPQVQQRKERPSSEVEVNELLSGAIHSRIGCGQID